MLSDGETGGVLGVVQHRDSHALGRFLDRQSPKWRARVRVVVSDASGAYRSAIDRWLPDADQVLGRFHVARWFAGCLIEVRRRIQRIGERGARPAFDPDIFGSRYLQVMRCDHLDDIAIAARERAEIIDQEWREVAEGWSETAEGDLVGAGVHSRPDVSFERLVGLVERLSHFPRLGGPVPQEEATPAHARRHRWSARAHAGEATSVDFAVTAPRDRQRRGRRRAGSQWPG